MDRTNASLVCFEALAATLGEYLRETSIPGYRYLRGRRFTAERLFWWTLNSVLLMAVVKVSLAIFDEYAQTPTQVWQESFRYPVEQVPFPAVAICQHNKISRSRAQAFASRIADISGMAVEEIMSRIRLLGSLYDFDTNTEDIDQMVQFQKLLDESDWNRTQSLNTYGLLKHLTMDCSETLSDCTWEGRPRACADLFVNALTMEGPCCVFNYLVVALRKSVSRSLASNGYQPLRVRHAHKNGLTVKIASDVDDYVYKTLSTTGVRIILGNPLAFFDSYSGGVGQALGPVGHVTLISVLARVLVTSEAARILAPHQRDCYFEDERETLFGHYTLNNCLSQCKIRAMAALCQCIPFQFVFFYKDSDLYQCTLNDLPCLTKYREKWTSFYPEGHGISNLEREKQAALKCNCLSACSSVSYVISAQNRLLFQSRTSDLNYTLLRVEFGRNFGILLFKDVVWFWFDMIGNFGGFCSLFMGISLLGLIEIAFYATSRFHSRLLDYSTRR